MRFDLVNIRAERFGSCKDRHGDRRSDCVIWIEISFTAVDFIAKANVEINEDTAWEARKFIGRPMVMMRVVNARGADLLRQRIQSRRFLLTGGG